MGEFFLILIGYFVFLLMNYKKANEISKQNKFEQDDNKQYAIKFNKPVWFKTIEKDKEVYIETRSGRKVFKGIDKNGFKRWYYFDSKQPMQYFKDERILQSLSCNQTVAFAEDKKWCIAENFWDDSIIRLNNNISLGNTYLDDFTDRNNPFEIIEWNKYVNEWNNNNPHKTSKNFIRNNIGVSIYYSATPQQQNKYKNYFYDNNPLNQKIYLKNMRPYQLYAIATSDTKTNNDLIKQKQYLIRFGNPNYFDFKTQHCISDKQVNTFWSKWYAITEEEYLNLTTTNEELNDDYRTLKINTVSNLKFILKQINMSDLAFDKGIENPQWKLKNCGIKKAFDNEGNFVGE